MWRQIRLALFSLASVAPVFATPFTWGDNILKPLNFPPGTTITIYIQPDPKGLGRDVLIKDGVLRWQNTLSDHNITIDVKIQAPPPSQPANSMVYSFAPDGTKQGSGELGPGPTQNDGLGQATSSATQIVSGQALIRDALPAGSDEEKNLLRNLSQHEMTHMLGLDDDAAGKVTNHEQTGDARTAADYNARDKAEVNQLYAASGTGGTQFPRGLVTSIGGDAALRFYDYSLAFQAAGNPLLDPQHVALVDLGINPTLVTSLDLPVGWVGLIPLGVPDRNDPFFAGSMLDGEPGLSPFDPLHPISYIAIRNTDPAAALSPDNPLLFIRVHTTALARNGSVGVYAGGDIQSVFGPISVPEPSTFVLGIAAAMVLLKSRRTS